MNARGKKSDRKEREQKLDQAIEMTFPASDPIAVGRPTSTEAQRGRPVNAKARSKDQRAVGMRFTVGLKLKGQGASPRGRWRRRTDRCPEREM
jgi:hypothetical protein